MGDNLGFATFWGGCYWNSMDFLFIVQLILLTGYHLARKIWSEVSGLETMVTLFLWQLRIPSWRLAGLVGCVFGTILHTWWTKRIECGSLSVEFNQTDPQRQDVSEWFVCVNWLWQIRESLHHVITARSYLMFWGCSSAGSRCGWLDTLGLTHCSLDLPMFVVGRRLSCVLQLFCWREVLYFEVHCNTPALTALEAPYYWSWSMLHAILFGNRQHEMTHLTFWSGRQWLERLEPLYWLAANSWGGICTSDEII